MQNDWTGNQRSIYVTLGASNHVAEDRAEYDYYATDPRAVELLLRLEAFSHNIWEPASGGGHIAAVLRDHGHNVRCSDIVDRTGDTEIVDFLEYDGTFNGDIITNPPYKYAKEFCEKALEVIPVGNKIAMFLKLQFLEGKARKNLFINNPPKIVYVSSSRLKCVKNGDFASQGDTSSAVAYAWYIWEKGYTGNTIITWFN